MGWIQDGAYDHEGWVANVLDDGRASSGTVIGGVLLREVTAADRAAGYQIRALCSSEEVVIPWDRVATWQVHCECGWRGSSRPAVADEHGDKDCPETIEDDFLPEWKAHVAPFDALNGLGRLVAEQRAIEASIEEKVRLARRHGASWSDIGRATRISKQGAQQRWGATS